MKYQNPDLGKSDQNTLGPINFRDFAKIYAQKRVTCIIGPTKFRIFGPIDGF